MLEFKSRRMWQQTEKSVDPCNIRILLYELHPEVFETMMKSGMNRMSYAYNMSWKANMEIA